jgi:23S rRNA (pseudouridine1915-N3)-methyltransferase
MHKIKIISIGKDKEEWMSEGIAHYTKLLKKYAQLEIITLPSVKSASSLPQDMLLEKEAETFRKELRGAKYIALWDRGKVYDSTVFARYMEKQFLHVGELTLLIGGPYGLHESIISGASAALSLSAMTYTHQLVRLMLLEQLYRAFSILGGSPYAK